ncbi:MAG TPA: helix-turn-helix domain-containing protein [Puia sp.]|nr:helix-turn-helix domain-containing protein [Puia sp.]
MILQDFLPAPEVRGFVQCYRIVHFNFNDFQEVPFKAYPPKPEQILHFFLRDHFAVEHPDGTKALQPSILFAGQRTRLVNQYQGRDFLDVQIVFQPAGIYRLTRIPACELIDRHFDAESIFPRHVRAVLDRLQSASGYNSFIPIVETFVNGLIDSVAVDAIPLDLVSERLGKNPTCLSVEKMAVQACLSVRQFERSFVERVGVNPKMYARIARLNRAYNLRNKYPGKKWSDISVAAGYFDYQHLVKEYKVLTGMAPAGLHQLESRSPESVLDLSRALYHQRWQSGL